MKENNFNNIMTDADFDARCRSMLQASEAVAPEPRADLFADAAPQGAALRWVKWGAAAIIVAGTAMWMTTSDSSPAAASPVEALQPAAELEAPVSGASVSEATLMAAPTEQASAEAAAPEADGAMASPTVESPSFSVASTPDVSAAPATVTETQVTPSTSSNAVADRSEPAAPAAVEDMEAMGQEANAYPAEKALPTVEPIPETQAIPEDAPEASPKLTLPLTLPTGGGQR